MTVRQLKSCTKLRFEDHNLLSKYLTALALMMVWSCNALGQELSPRAFWPAPVGTKVLVLGYSHASGDVLMDRSIPIYGVDSKIDTAFFGYMETFSLWGRTSNVLLEVPYSTGETKGILVDEPAQRDVAGFNDLGISMTVNLVGAPAMNREEFLALRADPHWLLGINFKVVPPSGHYDDDRLINVGANRWASRVKLGSVIPLHQRWLLELEAGAWFFGDDDEFIAGNREQEPVYSAEAHLVHRFRPGLWASLEANYFTGGRQTVGGDELADTQSNRRFGGTLVYPFAGRHAIKVGYSKGTRTRYGNDFTQFIFTYQVLLP